MKILGRSAYVWLAVTFSMGDILCQAQSLKFEHFGTEAGLSQSTVTCIIQDHLGFMWFGTRDGLNKFDGYKFTVYRSEAQNLQSLSSNYITDIVEDSNRNLWIGTYGGGLNKLDVSSQKFTRYQHNDTASFSIAADYINALWIDHAGQLWIGTDKGLDVMQNLDGRFRHYKHDRDDPFSLTDNHIKDVFEDSKHQIWVGTLEGGLNRLDPNEGTFTNFKWFPGNDNSLSSNTVNVIFEDHAGQLWVGTRGGGLNLFDRAKENFKRFVNNPSNHQSIGRDVVLSIAQDQQHRLWVGTENGGLSILDANTHLFHNFHHDEIDHASLSNNSIWSLRQDRYGNMWVGTFTGGINFLNVNTKKFKHYRRTSSPNSLSNNTVISIYEDADRDLWIGTDGGGLNQFDRKNGTFQRYFNSVSTQEHQYILKVIQDHDGNLWIGTWGSGVIVFNKKKNTYRYYRHDPSNPQSLSNDNAWTIFEDSDNNIWIGTYGGGLNRFNPTKNTFTHFQHNLTDSTTISDNHINTIIEDSAGFLWIGTNENGIERFDKRTNTFTHYRHSTQKNSICNNSVNSVLADQNQLWIGTDFGLSHLDIPTGRFTNYHVADGLPNETVLAVLKDSNGYLWLSTDHGLSRFDPNVGLFTNFDVADGLQSNEFKTAACLSKNGTMYFGGVNGFNEFLPDSIKSNPYDPPLVFTDFQILNKSISPSLSQAQNYKDQPIRLTHDQSVISFEFATLNFSTRDRKHYAYILEGFDKSWNYTDTRHAATYTNLDPGNYVFRVRGQDSEGNWSDHATSCALVITPPFWMTWWFKIAAATLTLGLIATALVLRERFVRRQRLNLVEQVQKRTKELRAISKKETKARKEAERARLEAEQASRAKSIFLATMSHELRTPMNGVIGMASLLSNTSLDNEQREYADTIKTCSDSLLGVINDILDYSKIESGKMELEQNDFDLRNCIEEVLDIFSGRAAQLGLDLIYQLDHNVPSQIVGDNLRLRQILTNLVSNAIKFTNQGEVFVGIHLVRWQGQECELNFEVRDTGIGIPDDKIDRLFKAFSQVDSSTTRRYGGTGLGLAISQKLISLMGGSISVKSEVGQGTTFSFSLRTSVSSKPLPTYVYANLDSLVGKRILVVDDNLTNRNILKTQFEAWKLVPTLAASAVEALNILSGKEQFDMIITDMQMPQMDGAQLAHEIRKHDKIIPIVLLSSLGDDRNRNAELFTTTLTKPVKQSILCRTILEGIQKQSNDNVQRVELKPIFQSDISKSYPLRILVAEDNPMNQRLAERILDKLGYIPQIVTTGRQAVEAENKNHFDLIFMDVQMPEMDGLEATTHIRAADNPQPVIIAMTANAMKSDQEECMRVGMNDYISKPIKLDDLIGKLEKWAKHIQENIRLGASPGISKL